ncbi:MAG: DUF4926 domain-containing protein [Planctomycetes bacterium]|nr:DUF4926 domain-containing protein [Planctomycetota bacterium]
MALAEHSLAVLNREIPDAGLAAGDVGAIVHVYGQGKANEVEFVDGDGTTVALLTLDATDVRPLREGELLHARRRA